MSTATQATPRANEHPLTHSRPNSARPRGNVPPVVGSLKEGVTKTSKDKAKASYNIILVGETGVGKTSALELIANSLAGNDIDHYNFGILEHSTEEGGSENQGQTNSTRLYELTSRNGIVVRILDTPGLADTRNIQHNEFHKKSIATQINKHFDSITAVLVVANGTVPRLTVKNDYGLAALSAIFPEGPTDNVAFLLTNTSNPLYQNFSVDTLPDALKSAPQFLLNNPIALQRKYLELKDHANMKGRRMYFREAVQAAEQDAGEMLVDLFGWLGGLESQPMTKIVPLHEKCQNTVAKVARQIRQLLRKIK